MLTWQLGEVTLTRIEEDERLGSVTLENFFAGFDRAAFDRHLHWMVPDYYSSQHDRLVISSHSWLIRSQGLTILLDCCSGNHKYRPFNPAFHQLDTPFIERLAAAGVRPEQVDIVMCTHLHADHVGWNTCLRDGRWVPTFPNARYLFSRSENDFWQEQVKTVLRDNPGRVAVYEDSVLPVIDAGLAQMLEDDHEINRDLLIERAPGHTPGHIVLKIDSKGARGVYSGDAIHHPIQLYEPQWNTRFCVDQEGARRTRRALLDHCADSPALLFPIHFGKPYVTKVLRRGDAFAPEFVPGRIVSAT